MFKSPNDTSRWYFPSEDLFVISEVRDVKSIKNPSCVLPWGIFPRFFFPVSLEICVEMFKQQCCCGFTC